MASSRRPAKKQPAKKASTTGGKGAAKKTPPRKRPTKKTARATAARRVTARDRQVVERREAGQQLAAIARELKFRDADAAHQAYERALDRDLPPPPTEQRRLDLQQLRDREDKLWPQADAGSLAAIAELAQIHLQRARLNAAGPLLEQNRRELGPVETATVAECEALARNAPALAAAAVVLARTVDQTPAEEPGPRASAARELRMSMSNLRGLAGLQAPDGPDRSEDDQAQQQGKKTGDKSKQRGGKGSTVVEASVLETLRRQGDRR